MSTSRGRPPRGLCLAGGIIGSTMAHCSSVRSEGYTFRELPSCPIYAYSSAERICANYLTNLLLCQVIFPDSLLVEKNCSPMPSAYSWTVQLSQDWLRWCTGVC